MERKKICLALLDYFLDEYAEVGKAWFLNETMCPHKMMAFKKLAKMVHYAHEAYHIAIERAHGVERDWHGDHDHAYKSTEGMPTPIHDNARGYAASGRHPDDNPRRHPM